MSRTELLMELGELRKKMSEGRNIFRTDVQLTNSYSNPTALVILVTMLVGSLIEGKSLQSENWNTIKRSFNPYEEFRQKVINYDPLCMSMKTYKIITKLLDQHKAELNPTRIMERTSELHYLLFKWMLVVLKLKEWNNEYGEHLQKNLFQTRFVSDVTIQLINEDE